MNEQEIQLNMNKSIEATQRSFNTIRTGRANASLLDRISIEYYDVEGKEVLSKVFYKGGELSNEGGSTYGQSNKFGLYRSE